MGVFDLPAPLFAWLDTHLSQFAPPAARLALWGVFSAVFSMALYWFISPQERIKQNQARTLEARQALNSYQGDFAGAWPQMRSMLSLALKQVGIVTLPAIAASLPVLCVLVWMSTAYGYQYPPPGSSVEIRTFPRQQQTRWVLGNAFTNKSGSRPQVPRIELHKTRGRMARIVPLPVPVPAVHKRQWWNVLFGNPAGYLPDRAQIERVEIDLPPKQVLAIGPSWLRSWEFLYLTVLLVSSIVIKIAFKIK